MMAVWDWVAVLASSSLIAYGLHAAAPVRPRRRSPAPAQQSFADYPTTPIPTISTAQQPVLETRLMLRRDELLWAKSGDDDEGIITLGLLPEEGGQLGVLVDDNGIALGVRLDRHEVQSLRDAITCHLVATAKPVSS